MDMHALTFVFFVLMLDSTFPIGVLFVAVVFFLAFWCHLLHLPLSLCNNPIQINLKLEKLCEVNGFVRKELSVRDKVELFESLVNHNI